MQTNNRRREHKSLECVNCTSTKIVNIIKKRKKDESRLIGDELRKRTLGRWAPSGRRILIRGNYSGEKRPSTK